jgi:hypothetical protein
MQRRVTLVTLVLTAFLVVFVSEGTAAKPVRGPALGPPSLSFPAGMVCPFEVFAEAVENRQTETVFSDGTIVYTGFFLTRLVNVENDKELTLVSQGPVRLSPEGENLRISTQGPIIFFFFPGDAGPGDDSVGRTYIFHGNTSTLVDPATGLFLSFDYRGRATDLCAALA